MLEAAIEYSWNYHLQVSYEGVIKDEIQLVFIIRPIIALFIILMILSLPHLGM